MFTDGFDKEAKVLTSKGRKHIAEENFALPGRRYPIHDLAHARNAIARVMQNGTSAEQASVKAAVYKKYPALKERHEESESTAKANPRSLAYKLERAVNWPIGKLRTRGQSLRKGLGQFHKDLVAGGKAGRTPTRFSPEGAAKRSPGGALTERRLSKAVSSRESAGKPMNARELDQTHASIEGKTKSQLHERKKRLGEHLEKMKKGPSFAMRHPFLTAGSTLLAAKHLLKDDKQGPAGAQDNNWVGGG